MTATTDGGERIAAQTLRALRLALGLTQEGWAATLGYSWSTVQRWEDGSIAPERYTLMHIREVLRRPLFGQLLHEQPDLERVLVAAHLLFPVSPGSAG